MKIQRDSIKKKIIIILKPPDRKHPSKQCVAINYN